MPDTQPPSRRRPWLATPLASLVLGAVLLADVLTLPAETAVGGFIAEKLRPEVHCDAPRAPMAYLVREDGALRLAEFDDPIAQAYRAGESDPEVYRAILNCEPDITRSGFWAITRASFDHSIRVRRRVDEALPKAELATARAMFAPYAVERGLSPEMGRYMAQGDGRASLIRWDGYLRNIGSLLVAIGFVLSLRWIIN